MNNIAQLKVELKKNDDGSVSGMLPSGLVCRWPSYLESKPTKRNKYVTVNCFRWPCVWVDKFSEELTIEKLLQDKGV